MVVDTHVAIWYLIEPVRLSLAARAAVEDAALAADPVFVPAVCLVELRYLIDKERLPEIVMERLVAALLQPDASLAVTPLDFVVARAVGEIPRSAVPDLPDRIIAATALHLNLPLINRDAKIRASRVTTIW